MSTTTETPFPLGPDITVDWSEEAVVHMPDGKVCAVFQMNTYAVRAATQDRCVVAVLPLGARAHDLRHDDEYLEGKLWPAMRHALDSPPWPPHIVIEAPSR